MPSKFIKGELVIFAKGNDDFELGQVKSVVEPTKEQPDYYYFVNYHTGETAARTPEKYLHRIQNSYAFDIKRIKCE